MFYKDQQPEYIQNTNTIQYIPIIGNTQYNMSKSEVVSEGKALTPTQTSLVFISWHPPAALTLPSPLFLLECPGPFQSFLLCSCECYLEERCVARWALPGLWAWPSCLWPSAPSWPTCFCCFLWGKSVISRRISCPGTSGTLVDWEEVDCW